MNIGFENETIEFKKSTSELKEGIISISSILNKHGHGILYFGVKDNGDVIGQDVGRETQRDISREITNSIKPQCYYSIELKRDSMDKSFIEVTFNGDRAPYSAYGIYYLRFADEDRKISDVELEKLLRKRNKDYSHWELSNSNFEIDDVDEDLLRDKFNFGHEHNRISETYSNSKAALSKLGLLYKQNYLNNAGHVLFGIDKPVLLKLAVLASETKSVFIKLLHFQGNIFECIEKSITFIYENINFNIVIDGSIQRKEEPEIPSEAIREIVLNAFCHADYNANTTFEVDVFKDRVEIYNPGFFPLGYSPNDFAFENQKSVMLNPTIMEVLFKTNEVESFGYGFAKTFEICKQKGVEYKFENTKSGFLFTFYRKSANKKSLELSQTEKDVLSLLLTDNALTNIKMAKMLNKSQKTIARAIYELKEKNYIVRHGNNIVGYWEILKTI